MDKPNIKGVLCYPSTFRNIILVSGKNKGMFIACIALTFDFSVTVFILVNFIKDSCRRGI
jgi:hypothetical protein